MMISPFASLLRWWRIQNGWDIPDVAAAAHMMAPRIRRFESGRDHPTANEAQALISAYRFPPAMIAVALRLSGLEPIDEVARFRYASRL